MMNEEGHIAESRADGVEEEGKEMGEYADIEEAEIEYTAAVLSEIDTDKNISIFDPAVKKEISGILKLAVAGQIFTIVLMVCCVNILFGFAWNSIPYTRDKIHIAGMGM